MFHHTLVSFIDDKRRAFLSSIDDKTMLLWRCTLRNSRNAEVDFVIFDERQTIQGACSMWKGEMTELLME